jgi:hypothetical protein
MSTVTSATYEIDPRYNNVRETHSKDVAVYFQPGGVPMKTDIGPRSAEPRLFEPRRVVLGWTWSSADDGWQLITLRVVGLLLNKDWKVNARYIQDGRSFLSAAGTPMPDTPDQLLKLVDEHTPTSKVVQ